MSKPGHLIRAQQLERGCMIEIEGEGYGTSIAKVQAVREKALGVEIDLYARKPIPIPAGCASVNYWTLLVPLDTPVKVSHLPSQLARDTSAAHGGETQAQRDARSAEAG